MVMCVGVVSATYVKIEPSTSSNDFGPLAYDEDWNTFATASDNDLFTKGYLTLDSNKDYYMKRKYNIDGEIVESFWKIPDDCLDHLPLKTYEYFYADDYVIFTCYDQGGFTTTPYIFSEHPQQDYYENALYEYVPPTRNYRFKRGFYRFGRGRFRFKR